MLLQINFIVTGYLAGSVLFARLAAHLMEKDAAFSDSKDRNPGTANAFRYGGFWCGLITLTGDVLKGFLPVYFYLRAGGDFSGFSLLKQLVLAAPVLGHIFPLYFGFHGGKGIAVTFGCLLGLLPDWKPVALLAACFLFFSTVLRITPHFYRTIVTYLVAAPGMLLAENEAGVSVGFLWIAGAVLWKLHQSEEELPPMEVTRLWMR